MKTNKEQLSQQVQQLAKKEHQSKWRTGNEVVGYTRVSDNSQMDNTSLETQKKDAIRFAERRGLIIKEFFGGIVESAKTDERKEFKRMLQYVKKEKSISAILVYSYERFSRSEYAIQLSRELAKQGVKVLSVIQEIDVTSASGRLQQDIFYAFGNYDNGLRKEKTVRGMVENLLNGYWVGVCPFGYTNLKVREKAKYHEYIINEDGKILKQAFQLKAEGKLNNLEIVEKMKKRGSTIKYKSFVRILNNPFYCGYITHSLIPGKSIKGKHPALVSEELFFKANNVVATNPHKGISKKSKKPALPLKSFLRSEQTGIPFTGYFQKGFYYYKTRAKTEAVNVRADFLNQLFEAELAKLQVNEQLRSQIEMLTTELVKRKLEEQINEVQSAKKQAKELETKLENLEQRFIDGDLTKELFEKYSSKYKEELKQINGNNVESQFDSSNLEKAIKKSFEIACNPLQAWLSADYDDKQRLQYLIFPDGIMYNKEKRIVRTTRVNSLFVLMSSAARVSEEKKKSCSSKNSLHSHLVALNGMDSNQIIIELKNMMKFPNLKI